MHSSVRDLFFFVLFTLIVQQKASGVVKPLRSDEVECQHVRVGDNPRTRDGAAELEECAAAFPYSDDVHAVAIRVWTCEHLFAVSACGVCLRNALVK